MKRREAEKLLGGYATGILTEAERRVLFGAALEHQEVFDALMDEEALRELLADPAARNRLLSILSDANVPRVRVFWRRPAVLGLAASFFILVTTTAILRQRRQERVFESAQLEQEAPKNMELDRLAEEPMAASEKAEQAQGEANEAKATQTSAAPVAGQAKEKGRKLASQIASRVESEDRRETKLEASAAEPPTAIEPPAGGARPSPVPAPSALPEPTKSLSARAKVADEQSKRVSSSELRKPTLAPPACSVETLGGRIRLTVVWPREGHLYVLGRSHSGAVAMKPLETRPSDDSFISVFEYDPGEREAVEVYLMLAPVQDPTRLPAEGPIDGYRWRETSKAP